MCGLVAATFFGASTPLAKILLPAAGPVVLAGLLYLGAGTAMVLAGFLPGRPGIRAARLRKSDLGWLTGIVILGGIIGPVLMLYGLARVGAVVASLLLNLEAPFTMLLAVFLFGEHMGRAAAGAASIIVAGATLLSYRPGELSADWLGVLAIAGACLCWAADNNFSQRLSLRDPIAVVRTKALTAAAGTLSIALAAGEVLPGPSVIMPALVVGAIGYGISILAARRQRRAGARR
ncbi:MAG: DMT family transporter [Acidobacteriota bacterium]